MATPILQARYKDEVVQALMEEFKYSNVMEVPRVQKMVINIGLGEANENPKLLDGAVEDLRLITGQQPIITKSKKAIASFKLRENLPIGCKVTLLGERMYEFLDRLITVAIPRIRDFRGVSARAFDGRGNYTLGVKEQIIFPEIQYDAIDQLRGMDITITTTAVNNEQGRALLEAFNFPFRK